MKRLICLLLVLGILFIGNVSATAFVQRGTETMTTTTLNIPINEVNTSRSLILISERSVGNAPDIHLMTANFTNSTTLTIYRYATTSAVVSWEVIENSEFNVQRGTTSFAAGNSILSNTINSVDLSKSFIVVNSRINSATGADFLKALFKADFVNSSAISFERAVTDTVAEVGWQVVEWNGASVQSGNVIATNTGATSSIDSVNLSQSLISISYMSDGNAVRRAFPRTYFIDETQINSIKGQTGGTTTVSYFVISHPALYVQSGETSYTSSATGTFSSINTSRTFSISSFSSTDSSSGTLSRAYATRILSNPTTISFEKVTATGTNTDAWFVVEIRETPVPDLYIISPTNTTYNNATQLVNISAEQDGLVEILYNWNGTNYTYTVPIYVDFDEGANTLYVWANYTGDSIISTNVSFTIDTIAPLIDFGENTDESGSVLTDRKNIFVNVSAYDSGSGLKNLTIYFYNSTDLLFTNTSSANVFSVNYTNLVDGIYYFNATAFDNAENYNFTETWNVTINRTPSIRYINASPNPVPGGWPVTIFSYEVLHPNNSTLYFYCINDSLTPPTPLNSICESGNLTHAGPNYNLTCEFLSPEDQGDYDVFCRVYDGELYSNTVNTTYSVLTAPPVTFVVSVAGDTTPSYFDTVNDGVTEIIVEGDKDLFCRWSASDLGYYSMTNTCSNSGNRSTCVINDVASQGFYTRYISCADEFGVGQTSSTNLDVSFYLDYTAPTTYDNSVSTIKVPPYVVTITEQDNVDADPTTYYCTSSTSGCNPTTLIDDGGTISYTSANRGANYLRYYSIDFAGNSQTIVNKTININRLPVFVSATSNVSGIVSKNTLTNISSYSYDLDVSQELSLLVCNSTSVAATGCLDFEYCYSGGFSNLSCSFTSEDVSGTYTWYAFLYDELDEMAITNFSGTYTVDATPPTIIISAPSNTTYTQDSITSYIIGNEVLNWSAYSLNEEANVTMSRISATEWTKVISGLSNGLHNITFWANDSYGNYNQSEYVYFSVDTSSGDTTPPTITVLNPLNNNYYTSSSVLLNISTNEDLSWAGYSINESLIEDMGNTSTIHWNATVTFVEGLNNITFYANDTSDNQGTSSISIYVDLNNPSVDSLTCNSPVNNSQNVVCDVLVSDSIGLDYLIFSYNASGSWVNSSSIDLSGISNSSSYTILSGNTTPSEFRVQTYLFDLSGRLNDTEFYDVVVLDDVAPTINNVMYVPNTTAELDPGVQINVSVEVSDDYELGNVYLMYKNSSSDWDFVLMTNTSLIDYNASFIAVGEENWTFRINASDSTGNLNLSSNYSFSVEYDITQNNTNTIPLIKSFTYAQRSNANSVGVLTLNNTGDVELNFSIDLVSSSIQSRLDLNSTGNYSVNYSVGSGDSIDLEVFINTTSLIAGLYSYSVVIISEAGTETLERYLNIQTAEGAYLDTQITTYSETVSRGQTSVTFISRVSNLGTKDATGVYLNWSLPEEFSLASGNLTRYASAIPIGGSLTNTIKINVSDSTTSSSAVISANASSTNADSSSDSKTITITDPIVIEVPSTTPLTPSPGGGSAGGGSAGGGAGQQIVYDKVVDLVRGEKDYFEIIVENKFDSVLEGVSLTLTGFPSQHISIEPLIIPRIGPNENASFKVYLSAPVYE